MALPTLETALIGISLLPVWIALLSALGVGVWVTVRRLSPLDSEELTNSAVVIAVVVFGLLILIRQLCWCVTPVEAFDGTLSVDSVSQLMVDISSLEGTVCSFMAQTDQFLMNDVGPPGQTNPALVTQAQAQARATATATATAGATLTDCSGSGTTSTSTSTSSLSVEDQLFNADKRISQIELTLNEFTGPEFVKAYNAAMASQKCESFVGGPVPFTVWDRDHRSMEGFDTPPPPPPTLASLRARLTAAQQVAHKQQTQYLTPVQNMTTSLQQGHASDCQKKNGSSRAMGSGSGSGT